MTTKQLLALLMIAIAATVTFARARRTAGASVRTFDVVGVVAAPPADGRITVTHDAIAGYMPAMTMPFVLGPGVPARLTPGDRVRFTLRVAEDWSRTEDVRVVGHEAGGGHTAERGRSRGASAAFSIHAERNGVSIDHTLATAIVDGDGRLLEIWRGSAWKPAEVLEGLQRETPRLSH